MNRTNCLPLELPVYPVQIYKYCPVIHYKSHDGKQFMPDIGCDRKFYRSDLTPETHASNYKLLKLVLKKEGHDFDILYDCKGVLYTPVEIFPEGQVRNYLVLRFDEIPSDILEKIPRTKFGFTEIAFRFKPLTPFILSRTPQKDNSRLSVEDLEKQYATFIETIIYCSAIDSGLYSLYFSRFLKENKVSKQSDGSFIQVRFYKGVQFMEPSARKPAIYLDPWNSFYYPPVNLKTFVHKLLEIHRKSFEDFHFLENGVMSEDWNKLNEALTGLHVRDLANVRHRISGITRVPLKNTRDFKIYAEDKLVDENWPTVECEHRINGEITSFTYPMEFLTKETWKNTIDESNTKIPKMSADQYIEKLHETLENLHLHNGGQENNFMKRYGIEVGELLDVPSEMMTSPTVEHMNGELTAEKLQNSNISLRTKFIQPVESFVIKVLHTCEEQLSKCFVEVLKDMTTKRGIKIVNCEMEKIDKSELETTMENLKNWIKIPENPKKLVLVISEKKDMDFKGQFCCFQQKKDLPVMVIDSEEVDIIIRDEVACSTLIEKINIELGGLNYHVFTTSIRELIESKDIVIVAIDLEHTGRKVYRENYEQEPSPDPTIDAFAWTTMRNPTKTENKFYLRLHDQEHTPMKHIEDFLSSLFSKQLDAKNNLPNLLIFYKYTEFLNQLTPKDIGRDLARIKNVVNRLYQSYGLRSPKIVFQSILKHNEFRSFEVSGDGFKCTSPGTVISEPIVIGNKFYIQTNPKDMAKPLLVETVFNNSDISQRDLQQIFYTMVHCNQIRSQIFLPYVCVKAYAAIDHAKCLWKEYKRQGGPIPLMAHRGIYTSCPIDFDAVTRTLTETDKE